MNEERKKQTKKQTTINVDFVPNCEEGFVGRRTKANGSRRKDSKQQN